MWRSFCRTTNYTKKKLKVDDAYDNDHPRKGVYELCFGTLEKIEIRNYTKQIVQDEFQLQYTLFSCKESKRYLFEVSKPQALSTGVAAASDFLT